MTQLENYIIRYGAAALEINSTQILTLLALIQYRNQNGFSKICNPTYERIALANGQKNTKKITPITDALKEKGYITKCHYTDEETKKSRIQYTIHDSFIFDKCKAIEDEWYAKFKEQDESTANQAYVIANAEEFPQKEVEKAINPPLKPIPEGKQKSPITGRIQNRYVPPPQKGKAVSIREAMEKANLQDRIKREQDRHQSVESLIPPWQPLANDELIFDINSDICPF